MKKKIIGALALLTVSSAASAYFITPSGQFCYYSCASIDNMTVCFPICFG